MSSYNNILFCVFATIKTLLKSQHTSGRVLIYSLECLRCLQLTPKTFMIVCSINLTTKISPEVSIYSLTDLVNQTTKEIFSFSSKKSYLLVIHINISFKYVFTQYIITILSTAFVCLIRKVNKALDLTMIIKSHLHKPAPNRISTDIEINS